MKLRRIMKEEDTAEFSRLSESMAIPGTTAELVRKGLTHKEVTDECKAEAGALLTYIPSFEEFLAHIERLNPRPAGGPAGLHTYW